MLYYTKAKDGSNMLVIYARKEKAFYWFEIMDRSFIGPCSTGHIGLKDTRKVIGFNR